MRPMLGMFQQVLHVRVLLLVGDEKLNCSRCVALVLLNEQERFLTAPNGTLHVHLWP